MWLIDFNFILLKEVKKKYLFFFSETLKLLSLEFFIIFLFSKVKESDSIFPAFRQNLFEAK